MCTHKIHKIVWEIRNFYNLTGKTFQKVVSDWFRLVSYYNNCAEMLGSGFVLIEALELQVQYALRI